jgi:hypothetical protein
MGLFQPFPFLKRKAGWVFFSSRGHEVMEEPPHKETKSLAQLYNLWEWGGGRMKTKSRAKEITIIKNTSTKSFFTQIDRMLTCVALNT